MLDKDIFSHTGVNGSDPGDRIEAAGYQLTGDWRWGENISWRGSTGAAEDQVKSIETQNDALFKSPGHRVNILQDDFREVGTGIVSGDFKQYDALMVAENFGKTGNAVFLTGVAYDDLNDNDFYTPGEGRGGIKVEATLAGLRQACRAVGYDRHRRRIRDRRRSGDLFGEVLRRRSGRSGGPRRSPWATRTRSWT